MSKARQARSLTPVKDAVAKLPKGEQRKIRQRVEEIDAVLDLMEKDLLAVVLGLILEERALLVLPD